MNDGEKQASIARLFRRLTDYVRECQASDELNPCEKRMLALKAKATIDEGIQKHGMASLGADAQDAVKGLRAVIEDVLREHPDGE